MVAAGQQAPLLGVQRHGCQPPTAMAVLEVALTPPRVDVPHADGAALVTADDLRHARKCP